MDDYNSDDTLVCLPDRVYLYGDSYLDDLREVALRAAGCIVLFEPGEMLAWGDFRGVDVDAGILELAGCLDA